MWRLFILLIVFLSSNVYAALNTKEMAIAQYVKEHATDRLGLFEKIVNINSGTNNPKGVKNVADILIPEFQKLGFTTEWILEPKEMQRAGTLIATHRGSSGRRILLIGHLDTVFPKFSPFQKYKLVNKKLAIGPGVNDDKGGIILILTLLDALKANDALANTNITVVLTGDEEDSGKPTSISRKPLMIAAKGVDVAFDFEPAVTLDTLTVARRGISDWLIDVKADAGHSSTIFTKGAGSGAAFELVRILNKMRSKYANEEYLTFNPGLILSGSNLTYNPSEWKGSAVGKENVIANHALARGEVRYISVAQKDNFKKGMQKIVKKHLELAQSVITFQDGIPPMAPSSNNLAMLKRYSDVSEDLGMGSVKAFPAKLRGAADIAYVASVVPYNLSGLGPIGGGGHSMKESVDLSSISPQAQRAAILIYRLTH